MKRWLVAGVLSVTGLAWRLPALGEDRAVTVVFQNGLDGYLRGAAEAIEKLGP